MPSAHSAPTLAAREAEAIAAATSLTAVTAQLDGVTGQATAVAPLAPRLDALTARIEGLARHSAGMRAAAFGQWPPPATAPNALRLPTPLRMPNPLAGLAKKRRGPEAPHVPATLDAPSQAPAEEYLTPVAEATGITPTPRAAEPTSDQRSQPVAHRARYERARARDRAGPVPALELAAPRIADGPAGGGASTSSGGAGAGASAAAVLALAGVCLLGALLPGRLRLDPFPWRSALLASRLERPG
jgi:hypothetical protein